MSDEGDQAYRAAVILHEEIYGKCSLATEIAKRTRRLSWWIFFLVVILVQQGFLILGAVT